MYFVLALVTYGEIIFTFFDSFDMLPLLSVFSYHMHMIRIENFQSTSSLFPLACWRVKSSTSTWTVCCTGAIFIIFSLIQPFELLEWAHHYLSKNIEKLYFLFFVGEKHLTFWNEISFWKIVMCIVPLNFQYKFLCRNVALHLQNLTKRGMFWIPLNLYWFAYFIYAWIVMKRFVFISFLDDIYFTHKILLLPFLR